MHFLFLHEIYESISWIDLLQPYLNTLKYVLKGSWNDPLLGCRLGHSLHGERLPTSSLSIGENGAIVSLSDTLQNKTWPK